MKKLFLIFLLAMLPFQASWATVASYCQHEETRSAKHLGHHQHHHEGADAGADQHGDKKQPTGKNHIDCHYCHLACQASILSSSPVPPVGPADLFNSTALFAYSSYIADGPRRPDRQPVA